MIKHILILLMALLISMQASMASDFSLATTTSTKSSGLLERLIPAFEADTGLKIKVYSVGTGKALRMGRKGEVDVLLVHAPTAERQFVKDGYGINRMPVMKNNFILLGPKSDPAKVARLTSVEKAFSQISQTNSLFISRGDDSGTHKKEMSIWKACNIEPYGEWYFELGASMGVSLAEANEKSAYVLVDRGTWLANRKSIALELMVEGDALLENHYSVITVNPANNKVNAKLAKEFSLWLTGTKGKKLINSMRVDGEKPFTATH